MANLARKPDIRYASRMEAKKRRKKFHEIMVARFMKGTFRRIKRVQRPDEDRTDFIRAAVAQEIERREAAQ